RPRQSGFAEALLGRNQLAPLTNRAYPEENVGLPLALVRIKRGPARTAEDVHDIFAAVAAFDVFFRRSGQMKRARRRHHADAIGRAGDGLTIRAMADDR